MKKVVITFLLALLFTTGMAQSLSLQKPAAVEYPWQVGIGIGYTNYYGDVSNYRINKFSDIGKLYHFADFNHYYIPQPSYSLLLEKKINPTIGFMLQFNQVSFSMSDRYRNKNGTLDVAAPNFSRALNFKTSLHDAGFALTFSAATGHALKENSFFYPSFYIGGGVSVFNVYGDLYDANGNAYNYNQAGNINDGSFETNLRDIKTETPNRYSNITPYLDLGLSLNFRLSNMLSLSLQSDIKYSGTDYLDDVSGRYKSTYPSAVAAYAAHPGYNVIDPVTMQRGDANDVNDLYINNRLVLHISLAPKKQAAAFKAPSIYSLEYSYSPAVHIRHDTAVRRAWRADSTSQHLPDTLVIKQDTLPFQKYDTAYQQRVEHRLDSIQLQLKNIKTVIRNQAFEAKYQYLHFKQDSVRQLKKNIQAQKTISKEDNLRIRIYDLQYDSLRNEMLQLQRRAEAGMEDTDSSWRQSSAYQFNFTQPVIVNRAADSMPVKPDTAVTKADTLTDQQIARLSQSFTLLKNDKRYSKDSSYRRTIDSLNNKLAAYEKEKERMASEQQLTDTLTRLQGKNGTSALAQDSLRNNIRLNNAAATSLERDTAAEKKLLLLQSNLQKNNDSLRVLRNTLQQNRDSAAYYKRLAFAASAAADSITARPKKWYQRIIPGRTKKTDQLNEDEVQRIDDREKYYDAQLTRLNEKITDVQQRNHSLNDDYDRTRRRRDDRVYREPATVIRDNSYSRRDNNDLHDLRNEIATLRNQLLVQQAVETGVASRAEVVSRKAVKDTVYIRTPVTDSAQQPVANPQITAMQQEITRLKNELEAIKTPVVKPASAPAPASEKMETLSVYFGLGSASLSGAQQNKLATYEKKMAGHTNAVFILTGYTDAVGNASANNALARKRMEYVKNLLVTQYDINAANIQLEEPVTAAGKRQNALNRKVTIAVQEEK